MKVSCSSSKTTTIPLRDNLDLTIKDDDEAPPPVPSHSDDAISDWIQSPCSEAKYRFLASGHVEVQDEGILRASELPFGVGTWKELIEQVAEASGVSPALLAAIVAIESGGDPNLKSGGKMGLTQITYDIARKMSGGKFVSEDQILHPSWNLIHGSKYLGKCLDLERNNIVGALAMYNQGSKSCKVSSECPDRWGLWTDCGYVDKVIALMNTAVDEGYQGVMFVDLGGEDTKQEDGVLGILFFGALAASAAYGIGTMLTKKGGRK